ncbi:hypothetical protein QN399_25560 [Pseudomonas sp. 10C3]|uniref:hypothetical protein n=1 Tax=Pseudomonas sp. 10C3 TaxID=3118753 RepID=UPI002E7FF939|nr:hypothetical protein [Pseudomonas sp. 10C3]MEE3509571.1 hypothetical protein [Pseudomonas sp. 10C3]
MNKLSLLVLLGAVAGCSLAPLYERPTVPIAAAFPGSKACCRKADNFSVIPGYNAWSKSDSLQTVTCG